MPQKHLTAEMRIPFCICRPLNSNSMFVMSLLECLPFSNRNGKKKPRWIIEMLSITPLHFFRESQDIIVIIIAKWQCWRHSFYSICTIECFEIFIKLLLGGVFLQNLSFMLNSKLATRVAAIIRKDLLICSVILFYWDLIMLV